MLTLHTMRVGRVTDLCNDDVNDDVMFDICWTVVDNHYHRDYLLKDEQNLHNSSSANNVSSRVLSCDSFNVILFVDY